MRSTDDRSTAARIRDAAITEFATNGVGATSVRTIAGTAGVSPGLVIHHFGSKDQLRVACDEHIAAAIREIKTQAVAAGAGLDPLAVLREQGNGPPLAKYLARTLVDGSPSVNDLVDELVNDAVAYIDVGVESGMIRPSNFPKRRAAILMMWSLGALVLHEHVERLIGVDITAEMTDDPTAIASYFAPVIDIYGGFLTEAAAKQMTEALQDASEHPHQEKEPA